MAGRSAEPATRGTAKATTRRLMPASVDLIVRLRVAGGAEGVNI